MIDWDRVKELRFEIGAEDFVEVVGLFLEEADECIARIAPDNGAKALAADLHFLKGAALNLGFAALSGLCQEGERRASAGDTDVDVEAVRAAYLGCRAELESKAVATFAA
jgi:HPt (histidine-containing phosphotransfer) domain-containing protein